VAGDFRIYLSLESSLPKTRNIPYMLVKIIPLFLRPASSLIDQNKNPMKIY